MYTYAVKVNKEHDIWHPFIALYECMDVNERVIIKPEDSKKLGKYIFGIEVDGGINI